MIYKFKSKASGDVIMMGARGHEVLRVIGMEPTPEGRMEPASLPAAITAIEEAIAQQDMHTRRVDERSGAGTAANTSWVTLRQRTGPLVAMMKRARAENDEIVWQSVPRSMHSTRPIRSFNDADAFGTAARISKGTLDAAREVIRHRSESPGGQPR